MLSLKPQWTDTRFYLDGALFLEEGMHFNRNIYKVPPGMTNTIHVASKTGLFYWLTF